MEQDEVRGALASGGTFRASPTLLEILSPTGETLATFDARYFNTVQRSGQTVSVTRIGNSDVNITTASLADAEALEQVLQMGVATPVPADASAGSPPATDSGFNNVLKWGCIATLAIIGILAVCLIVALVFFRDTGDEPSNVVGMPSPTVDEIDPASVPQATPTASEPDPSPTSEPALPGGARDNPFPFGELAETGDWDLQVLEVVRGEDASDMLLEANPFNEPPPDGYEYVLVNMFARYTGDSNEVQEIDSFWLRSTGEARIKYPNIYPVTPEPVFDASLFNGGEVTGWTALLAQEDEDNLLLVFQDWASFDEEDVIYLALEEGASVEPVTEPLAEENDLGTQVDNPAPPGEQVVDETWEIQVIEHVRGQEALDMVMEANEFNEEPEPGMEYVLVHIGARNVSTSPEPQQISSFLFRITGDAGRVYDSTFVVSPSPALDHELYPGGEATGWITLTVPEGEQALRLVYEPWLAFNSDQRYLALE